MGSRDGPRRDAKFNSRQINVNHFILRNAKFYSRQNLLIYSKWKSIYKNYEPFTDQLQPIYFTCNDL